jgi:16S rRNA processing protein RimM
LAAFPLTSRPERLKSVFVNQTPMEVENTWMHGDHLIFKFQGIDSISDAEKLAGAEVSIPFEQRAELHDDEIYQSDLIGCEVFDVTGRSLGVVTDFEETGGPPLLHVGNLLIPFAKSICTTIDPANKRIIVNPPDGLLDLNVPGPQSPTPNP